MNEPISRSLVVHGASILLGFIALGWLLGHAAVRVKRFDRTVVAKGLSEREVPADVAIWPLTFQEAGNDLNALFVSLQKKNALITAFLGAHDIAAEAITVGAPAVTDRYAQAYGETANIAYRYTASSTVTVYSTDVEAVRKAMRDVISLGQKGVALSGEGYQGQTQFEFTGLARLKPEMIEEATKNARAVAEKFAADSESRLGKIRSAQQGQFSIENRDSTTPHIKKVRVVSTIEYHLAD
ncbi:MAG TPA: SIMPL domain-containing protein [Steroidobacteraceae bacterium]|nr:SIMPL domain-containing protein [Steroidobacteraceae bacterium]